MTDPARALAGRREQALLDLPRVRRMAGILAERCREPSWVRTLVASLDRFRRLTGHHDLEALLAAASDDVGVAERSLIAFARGPRWSTRRRRRGAGRGAEGLVPARWRSGAMATAARDDQH